MSLVVFLLGLALAILSHPKILTPLMRRLYNERVITPRQISPQKVELVKFAGANLSLFALGIILMLIGIITRDS